MADPTFSEAVREASDDIAAAVSRIEQNYEAETELHNVKAYLLNLLDLVERSPGIQAAADDLDRAVEALALTTNIDGSALLAKRQRILRDALLRFQQRIGSARPSAKALASLSSFSWKEPEAWRRDIGSAGSM